MYTKRYAKYIVLGVVGSCIISVIIILYLMALRVEDVPSIAQTEPTIDDESAPKIDPSATHLLITPPLPASSAEPTATETLISQPGGDSSAPATDPIPELFVKYEGIEQPASFDNDPTIVRTQFVTANFDILEKSLVTVPNQGREGLAVTLNLFDDVTLIANLTQVTANATGGETWQGQIEGAGHSQVTLIVQDDVLIGNLTVDHTQYQIRFIKDKVHAIHEINQNAFLPEAEPIVPQ